MLMPALARGELRCNRSDPINEYPSTSKRTRRSNAGSSRCSSGSRPEDTISKLRGLKERYEIHHGVKIKDSAQIAAVTLSTGNLTDRFLPDKAIDLIDEAAAKLRMEIDSMPVELDEAERRLRQIEIEKQALMKDDSKESKDKLAKLAKETAEIQATRDVLKAQWTSEKEIISKIRDIKEQIDQTKIGLERAEREGDLSKAAELKYGKLIELQRSLEAETRHLAETQAARKMLKEEVSDDDIAEVVSKWSGVPVTRMLESEVQKLIHMEDRIRQRVVGQDEALTAVANAIRRARSGLQDPNRPIGSFIFLGPTGVGKTEVAKGVAEFLFDDESAMIRIDFPSTRKAYGVALIVAPRLCRFD
jgi:ATP-dependent Clp protease ATP-binding subunit ClpB